MIILRWLQFILGALCITGGLLFCAVQMIGVFRFRYVLTRLHATAIGDTLGGGFILLGLVIFHGCSFATLKLLLLIGFLWLTTPVASHMVAKLEVFSKKSPQECCPVEEYSSAENEESEEADL